MKNLIFLFLVFFSQSSFSQTCEQGLNSCNSREKVSEQYYRDNYGWIPGWWATNGANFSAKPCTLVDPPYPFSPTEFRYVQPTQELCDVPKCSDGKILDEQFNCVSPPPSPPSSGSGSGSTTTPAGGSCDAVMAVCMNKLHEAETAGSLRMMGCEKRISPAAMVCLADTSGVGFDARCMGCPDGGSFSDWVFGNGNSLPDFTPKNSLGSRQSECTSKGGTWASSGDTWTCTTSSGVVSSYDSSGNPKTPQAVELNCGGDTGIACESTQLNSLNNLKDINKNIKDAFTLPTDAQDCSVGTACYAAKEKSILDSIKEKTGNIPANILNMKDLVMGSYLKPFVDDKSGGTCDAKGFEPITLSFKSIDGVVASYIQPLPGDFLCKLFGIVRIFLVTGAILVGLKTIVFGFVKAT